MNYGEWQSILQTERYVSDTVSQQHGRPCRVKIDRERFWACVKLGEKSLSTLAVYEVEGKRKFNPLPAPIQARLLEEVGGIRSVENIYHHFFKKLQEEEPEYFTNPTGGLFSLLLEYIVVTASLWFFSWFL